MGIDLGTRKIAISLFIEGELVDVYVYEAGVGALRGRQLAEVASYTHDIAVGYEIDHVWIEDVIIGNNRKYSLQLAQVLGAVLSKLNSLAVDVRLVDNKAWKKAIVGNGNATKDDVKGYIDTHHPAYALLCSADQDLYDATCVGLYGLDIVDKARHLQL
jgi:Holliday junction resolvasome RuvABC endonuclease subunit